MKAMPSSKQFNISWREEAVVINHWEMGLVLRPFLNVCLEIYLPDSNSDHFFSWYLILHSTFVKSLLSLNQSHIIQWSLQLLQPFSDWKTCIVVYYAMKSLAKGQQIPGLVNHTDYSYRENSFKKWASFRK